MSPSLSQNSLLRGETLQQVSLAGYTTWRVGGLARRLYIPADTEDLALFLAQLPADEPLLWVGLGSNLLVRDGGFAGTVIATAGVIGGIERDGLAIQAGAGVPCNKLARYSVKQGLTGGEFFVGIPGTLGGALAMNAGAWGGETWPLVDRVETIDRRGQRRWRAAEDFRFGYRQVEGPAGEWFVGARLLLSASDRDPADGLAAIKALLAERSASQPTGVATAGSVFRNPPGDHAARLIDSCGLKGRRCGGVRVSERHANFFINDADATAADIEQLIGEVARVVMREHRVRLKPEVCIVGERL